MDFKLAPIAQETHDKGVKGMTQTWFGLEFALNRVISLFDFLQSNCNAKNDLLELGRDRLNALQRLWVFLLVHMFIGTVHSSRVRATLAVHGGTYRDTWHTRARQATPCAWWAMHVSCLAPHAECIDVFDDAAPIGSCFERTESDDWVNEGCCKW